LRREQLANGNNNNVAKLLMTIGGLAPPQYDEDLGSAGILGPDLLSIVIRFQALSIPDEAFGTTTK
jgi:hypothetical protein